MTRDYRDSAAILSKDFLTMLESDPESFACLFYKPILTTPEDSVSDLIEDVVGNIETEERKIDYEDPIDARAREIPDDSLKYFATEAGDEADYYSGENGPKKILLNVADVPKQSIISWSEKKDDEDDITVEYYVLESEPFGRAPVVGYVHYCIPLFSTDVKDGV